VLRCGSIGQQRGWTLTEKTSDQVELAIAEIFERLFVPALSQPWVGPVCDAAALASGQSVLDVACGTGALAREALKRVGPGGSVAGIDSAPAMLAVARRVAPGIDWRFAGAEAVPFADDRFDAVVSQFGLMFFDDRVAGLREMRRVVRPGGRVALAVWDRLEATPAYADLVALLDRRIGKWAADAVSSPFELGDPAEVLALFHAAGLDDATVHSHHGVARFDSIAEWIETDLKGWNLRGAIADDAYADLVAEAETALGRHAGADGDVMFAAPAHIVTAIAA
jgi:ubiquinone/menaquinone biosynthesis C-methylase UbiE